MKRISIIILTSIIIGLLTLYIGGFFFSSWAQELLIYPNPGRTNADCDREISENMVKQDNTTLFHHHVDNSDAVVIFYHGNGNIVCDMTFLIDIFNKNEISYIFVEYPGYNNDGIKATHQGVLESVHTTVNYIDEQDYENVYVIGQSIGSGAAAYHVSLKAPEKLLLISPFTTLTNVVDAMIPIYPRFLIERFLDDQFDNRSRLADYIGELTVVHGINDPVINSSHGKELFESIPAETKEFITAEGYEHADITQSQEMTDAVKKIVQ